MRPLIFIAPNDFRDETLNGLRLFFDKWGVKYALTSYSKKDCNGSHGAIAKLDVNTNNVDASGYDGIIIVDGKGIDTYKLYEFRPLMDLVLKFVKSGKFVAAVGNGIKVLAKTNVIKDRKIATPEDEETKRLVLLFHGIPSKEGVEVAGNILTIRDSSNLDATIPKMLEGLGLT